MVGRAHLHQRRAERADQRSAVGGTDAIIVGFVVGERALGGFWPHHRGRQLLAVFMANRRRAWDNARRYRGEPSNKAANTGKGSERHRLASLATRSATRSRIPPARR